MASKKDFTKADGAIDKLFSTNQSNDTTNLNTTKHTNNYKHSKPTNISKHYNERGRRSERLGLLIDEQLREDLSHLFKATGSRSVNDLIITILLEYMEREDVKKKLKHYRQLL